MKFFLLPIALLIANFSSTVNAEIYKWTDNNGEMNYSSSPPQENPESAQKIEDKIKAIIGKVQPPVARTTPPENGDQTKKQQRPQGRNNSSSNQGEDVRGQRPPAQQTP